jgi:hypothetical protein
LKLILQFLLAISYNNQADLNFNVRVTNLKDSVNPNCVMKHKPVNNEGKFAFVEIIVGIKPLFLLKRP